MFTRQTRLRVNFLETSLKELVVSLLQLPNDEIIRDFMMKMVE